MSLTHISDEAKDSTRSKAIRAGMYLQGSEIYSLRQERGMLPIVGRNEKYDVYHSETRKMGYEYDWFDDTKAVEYEPYIRFLNEESLTDLYTTSEYILYSDRQEVVYTEEAIEAKVRIDELSGSIGHKGDDRIWWIDNSASGSIRYRMPDNKLFEKVSFSIGDHPTGLGYNSTIHSKLTPYHDLEKYDAVRYVQGGANEGPPVGMEPIFGASPSYNETLAFQGIIEPFAIRDFLFGKSIFVGYESYPGGVFGELENPGMAEIGSNSFDRRELAWGITPYEDVGTRGFGSATTTADETQKALQLLDTEYINDEIKYIRPWEDRDMYAEVTPDAEIIGVLRLMDVTLDEGDLPPGFIPMATGWAGDRYDSRSSLTYRDLLR